MTIEEPLPLLHTAGEVLALQPGQLIAGRSAEETEILSSVARWAKAYLTKPHPDLGRSGHVCPWVEASMNKGLFFLTINRDHRDPEKVVRTFMRLQSHFLQLEPTSGRAAALKTIVTIFPDVSNEEAPSVINALHQRMKPSFVDKGLMLGEFYSTCDKPGLRNPNFRPLRSPIPLLVIRMMVPTDIAFLNDTKLYAGAYLKRFGMHGCDELLMYLDNHRAVLPPDRVAVLLDALHEFAPHLDKKIPEKDYVTGLFTMDHLLKRLDAELERRRPLVSYALLVFGVDRLDEVVRQLGKGGTSFIHYEVSRRAREGLRAENLLVRYGQSKFGILVPDISEPFAVIVAERLRGRIEASELTYEGKSLKVTSSVGVALAGPAEEGRPRPTAAELLARADAAYERASAKGGCVVMG